MCAMKKPMPPSMSMTDIEAKIKQLRDELNRHNYNYYVLNQPTKAVW